MRINPKGQAAVEFVLIAPFLFFIFFATIQLAYTAFVALAVQRAALAVARNASLSGPTALISFKVQLASSLLPVTGLNQTTLLSILEAQYDLTYSQNLKEVTAKVRYPMPIWVPLVGKLIGKPLIPSHHYNDSPEGRAIQTSFLILNEPVPDLSFKNNHLPVCWVTFEETTHNEIY